MIFCFYLTSKYEKHSETPVTIIFMAVEMGFIIIFFLQNPLPINGVINILSKTIYIYAHKDDVFLRLHFKYEFLFINLEQTYCNVLLRTS